MSKLHYSCMRVALPAIGVLLLAACEPTLPTVTSDNKSSAAKNVKSTTATAAGKGAAGAAVAAAEIPQVEIVPSNGEVCDGKDNDNNGLVDDADVEADGVCDCLKIASIGRPGIYGKGDIQFRTWPNAKAQHHVEPLENALLTSELLSAYDVLIVLNVSTTATKAGETAHHEFSESEVNAFESWVRAGGGVFTTAGYAGEVEEDVPNVNRLLAPFELGYDSVKYGLDGIIAKWTAHPVTEGVKRVYAEVGAVPIGAGALTLATDAKDQVALEVSKMDGLKIVVWGDEWITYASQWQAEADQQVERFWLNALTWLSRESSCQHEIKQ